MGFSRKAALALAAVALSAEFATAAPMVIDRPANLRAGPGPAYPLVGAISAGQVVDMGACVRGWCQVSWGGGLFMGAQTAYAPRAFLVAAAGAPVVASSAYWDTWGPFGIVAAPFALAAAPFYLATGVTAAATEPAQTVTVRRTRRVAAAPRATSTRVSRISTRTRVGTRSTVGVSTRSATNRSVERSTTGQGSVTATNKSRRTATQKTRRTTTGAGASGRAGGGAGGAGMSGGGSGGATSGY